MPVLCVTYYSAMCHCVCQSLTVVIVRSVKENMLHLLIHQQTTTVAQRVDANSITMETVPVVIATKSSQTEVTARVKTVDSEVQVELLPYNGE